MIQLEKPVLTGTMPVVWPTILDLGRDECKRILRKLGKFMQHKLNIGQPSSSILYTLFMQLSCDRNLNQDKKFILEFFRLNSHPFHCLSELEAYAGVISALRAQGDLTKDKKDLLGELTKILG